MDWTQPIVLRGGRVFIDHSGYVRHLRREILVSPVTAIRPVSKCVHAGAPSEVIPHCAHDQAWRIVLSRIYGNGRNEAAIDAVGVV